MPPLAFTTTLHGIWTRGYVSQNICTTGLEAVKHPNHPIFLAFLGRLCGETQHAARSKPATKSERPTQAASVGALNPWQKDSLSSALHPHSSHSDFLFSRCGEPPTRPCRNTRVPSNRDTYGMSSLSGCARVVQADSGSHESCRNSRVATPPLERIIDGATRLSPRRARQTCRLQNGNHPSLTRYRC